MGNNEVRIEKLLDSIPYYAGGTKEYNSTLHVMNELDISKIKSIQELDPRKMHYQMTLLYYDGYSIRSYSWQYIENDYIARSIKDAIYETGIHGAIAVILKYERKANPNVSIAVW